MRLYLMRHGIAVDPREPGCPPEPQRPLTKEGMEKTREVCRGLRGLGVQPDAVLSSPYLRALQTAEIACEILEFPHEKTRKAESLKPGGSPADFLKELEKIRANRVMCFGHAPQLDLLIAHLVGTRSSFTALKKAGVACFELESASAGNATLLWLAPPKLIRGLGD